MVLLRRNFFLRRYRIVSTSSDIISSVLKREKLVSSHFSLLTNNFTIYRLRSHCAAISRSRLLIRFYPRHIYFGSLECLEKVALYDTLHVCTVVPSLFVSRTRFRSKFTKRQHASLHITVRIDRWNECQVVRSLEIIRPFMNFVKSKIRNGDSSGKKIRAWFTNI